MQTSVPGLGLRGSRWAARLARSHLLLLAFSMACGLVACGQESQPALRQLPAPPPTAVAVAAAAEGSAGTAEAQEPGDTATALIARAKPIFGVLPAQVPHPDSPLTEAKITLGRQLYFETRLSQAKDMSCNSCHDLARYGVDVRTASAKTSSGHEGALGDRNAPTVYNAALHIAQFWDGRAADVEEQAKGPILNPVEMAMPDEATCVSVLGEIPGYAELFAAAFPDDPEPISYDNLARAIGAFERKLMTPGPFDRFLAGEADALTAKAQRGLSLFLDAGCTACHAGPGVGGQMYQKLGLVKPYATEDAGRAKVTGNASDRFFFKVPSLRNVAETAPYLHDGSIATLEEMVQLMAEYQTARGKLTAAETADLVAFLQALTGELPPKAYIAPPKPL